MPHHTPDEPLPSLSDPDVELLYAIVLEAQDLLPQLPPLRALFAVYDRRRAALGSAFDPDNVYSRFLLHLREPGDTAHGGGEVSLFRRFQALLDRLGIHVELDEEGQPGVDEITRRFDDLDLETLQRSPDSRGRSSARPSRRASFNSVYDTILEASHRSDDDSRVSRKEAPKRASSRASEPSGRVRSWSRRPRPAPPAARGRMNGRSVSDDLTMRKRSPSASSQGSIRITRERRDISNMLNGSRPRRSSDPTSSSVSAGPRSPVDFHVPPEMLYRPSNTEVLADADAFLHNQTVSRCRTLLHMWRDAAHVAREENARMLAVASALDRDTLLRQPFGLWRAGLQARRQAVETSRFFEQLEKRADRARDLFLLTKAFTHWARCAADEQQRTATARRHVLRSRHFHAWADITAVNALKARRLPLRKHLTIWQRRATTLGDAHATAEDANRHRILENAYRRWFWHFCDRRARPWADASLRRRVLHHWLALALPLRDRSNAVSTLRAHDVQRATLAAWTRRVQDLHDLHRRAAAFRRRALLRSAFHALARRAALDPPAIHFAATVDLRLVWTALTRWRRAAALARSAKAADRWRVLGNAWTTWNDALRVRAAVRMAAPRLMRECFSRWQVAARGNRLAWRRDVDLARRVIDIWRGRVQARRAALDDAATTVSTAHRSRLARSALHTWLAAARDRLASTNAAIAFRNHTLARTVLAPWTTAHDRISHLDTLCTHASFYRLTHPTLAAWRTATTAARARRRRAAYAAIRRQVKQNQARTALAAWRDATARVRGLEHMAVEKRDATTTTRAQVVVRDWRAKAVHAARLARVAAAVCARRREASVLRAWRMAMEEVRRREEVAEEARARGVAVSAKTCLRRLGWAAWQGQRRGETAAALGERFERARRAMMVRYWAQRAVERREERGGGFAATREEFVVPEAERDEEEDDEGFRGEGQDDDDDGTRALARAEASSLFDAHALDLGADLDLAPFTTYTPAPARAPGPPPPRPRSVPRPAAPAPGIAPPFAPQASFDPHPTQQQSAPLVTAATPLPPYLRTPSRRSAARAIPRDRLLGLTGTGRPGSVLPATPAPVPPPPLGASVARPALGAMTAPPPRMQEMSLPQTTPAIPGTVDRGGQVTSFAGKLRREGYGGGSGSARAPGTTGRARRVGFRGFEDVARREE